MTKEHRDIDFSTAKRSSKIPALARRQRANQGKERITIRLDADVLAWFRAQVKGGGNYQTLINDTLRTSIEADGAPLTVAKLREVLREELHAA